MKLLYVLIMMFLCTFAFADSDTPSGSYYSEQQVLNMLQDRATNGMRIQNLPGRTIGSGQLTIETPGTAEALSNDTAIVEVIISADWNNQGSVYVGDSSVDVTTGYKLSRDYDIVLRTDSLIDIYVDVEEANDKVSFIYTRK